MTATGKSLATDKSLVMIMEKPLSESDAVARCLAGDLSAFTFLYESYFERIYGFIFKRVRHKETAEDLTSTTFVKALERFSTFSLDRGNFSTWLYRIASNNIIDHYRSKREHDDIDEMIDIADNTDVEREVSASQDLQEVKKFLETLSEEQQSIITMRVWEGLSFKEIAQILQKSEASCKMMFSRSVKKIRSQFPAMSLLILLAVFTIIK